MAGGFHFQGERGKPLEKKKPTGGPCRSERERKGMRGWAGSVAGLVAPGRPSWAGFSFFLFFFSVSIFFLSFAIWLQTDSNNFVNFSKIQSIKVGQSETGFQNKIRFSIKPY
jgi:hypothetical protein